MIRLLLALLFLALPVAASAQAQQPPAPFRSDRILVETRGPVGGPDIVFIPGLGSTASAWRSTASQLQNRYRVHLITLRGFGQTDIGANASGGLEGPATTEILRYIRQQNLQRISVVGHSMGGQIALRVAAASPDRVSRVMVVDAAPFFPALIDERATSAEVEPIARIGYQALMLFGDQALQSQAARMGGDLGAAGDVLFRSLGLQGGDRRVLAQGLYEVMTVDLRPRLPAIRAPVTLVYGWSADSNNPRNRLDALWRASFRTLTSPIRYERIEGAEHQVMIEQPARFMQAMNRFLGE
ncbi:MAG: alpha/beta hydrolase [Brevundimonas sp.]|nr:MAG: alpha/beta hydrolase [Brevundimonas sp.]